MDFSIQLEKYVDDSMIHGIDFVPSAPGNHASRCTLGLHEQTFRASAAEPGKIPEIEVVLLDGKPVKGVLEGKHG